MYLLLNSRHDWLCNRRDLLLELLRVRLVVAKLEHGPGVAGWPATDSARSRWLLAHRVWQSRTRSAHSSARYARHFEHGTSHGPRVITQPAHALATSGRCTHSAMVALAAACASASRRCRASTTCTMKSKPPKGPVPGSLGRGRPDSECSHPSWTPHCALRDTMREPVALHVGAYTVMAHRTAGQAVYYQKGGGTVSKYMAIKRS